MGEAELRLNRRRWATVTAVGQCLAIGAQGNSPDIARVRVPPVTRDRARCGVVHMPNSSERFEIALKDQKLSRRRPGPRCAARVTRERPRSQCERRLRRRDPRRSGLHDWNCQQCGMADICVACRSPLGNRLVKRRRQLTGRHRQGFKTARFIEADHLRCCRDRRKRAPCTVHMQAGADAHGLPCPATDLIAPHNGF